MNRRKNLISLYTEQGGDALSELAANCVVPVQHVAGVLAADTEPSRQPGNTASLLPQGGEAVGCFVPSVAFHARIIHAGDDVVKCAVLIEIYTGFSRSGVLTNCT